MRISDWSSDVCSSDLMEPFGPTASLVFEVRRDLVERRHGLGEEVDGTARVGGGLGGEESQHVVVAEPGRLLGWARPCDEATVFGQQRGLDAALGGDEVEAVADEHEGGAGDRKSTRLNSSH